MLKLRLPHFIYIAALLFWSACASLAQNVVANLPVGNSPVSVAVNPVSNKIYVANSADGTVTVVDGATNKVSNVTVGTTPQSVGINPVTNKAYVADSGSNTVTVIDGATLSTSTVNVGTSPKFVAVNPVTNKIFVVNAGSNSVTVIDGATNGTSTVAVGSGPNSAAVNPVTNLIYVANSGSNNVTVINGANLATLTVAVGAEPFSVAVNPATNQIYVPNFNDNTLTVINGVNNATTTISVGTQPITVAVNTVTNKIYVANYGAANVTVVNGVNNATSTVVAGTNPIGLSVNATTDTIYVANSGSSNLTVINDVAGSTTILSVGTAPIAMAVNPVINKIYAANYGSASVTVVDGSSYTTAIVAPAGQAGPVAMNPVTQTIYVANGYTYDATNKVYVSAITVINAYTGLLHTITIGTFQYPNTPSTSAIAVNAVTNQFYAYQPSTNGGYLVVYDGTTNQEVSYFGVSGTQSPAMAVNEATNTIYLTNYQSNSIEVINLTKNTQTTIPNIAYPNYIAVNPITNKIYTAGADNSLTVIDGLTNASATFPLSGGEGSIVINKNTNKIYVGGSGNLTVIDGATTIMTGIPRKGTIGPLAVNEIANEIYEFGDGVYLTVIDGNTNSAYLIQTGSNTNAGSANIAVNPATNKIYSAIYNGLAILDGTTNTVVTITLGSTPTWLYANQLNGKTYLLAGGNIVVASVQATQALPLSTTIAPLSNNQTTTSTPTFTFNSASATGSIPDELLFQVDTLQGPWSAATGSNGTYSGTASALSPGFHSVYAYASDGQEATSNQPESPVIGSIQSYEFFVVGPSLQPQTVTFVNLPAEGAPGTSVNLSATASTAVTFTSSSAASICAVSGTTLSFNGIGTCTVIASAVQTNTYESANAYQNITVLQGQTITFPSVPTQTLGATVSLSATASSGLPVTFTSTTTSICTVSGTTATFSVAGTCTIQASQSGNSTYAAAAPVTQSFIVTAGLGFIAVSPCRVVDTRGTAGSLGGPSLSAGSTRSFPLPSGGCGLPASARAYSLNVTVVPQAALQYLSLWPTGQPQPVVSTLNSYDGRVVANAAVVPSGAAGAVSVYVTDQTDVIIDVNGYFGPIGTTGALTFVPVTPCRVEDTRTANGPLGGPILDAGSSRSFALPTSTCGIPSNASAYSLNATVVPTAALQYLTLYPTGTFQPTVSTLNSYTGDVVANAAIVPAGTNGAITAFVTDQTQFITDINGYFTSTPSTPLVFNVVTPCRIADTRNANGPFGGPILAAGSTRSFAVPTSACGIPSGASAYALNVTVVPAGALQYLTLWPDGQTQPTVSTLNSYTGRIVANAAIVPAGNNGAVDVFVTDQTHVILDIVGYFMAP